MIVRRYFHRLEYSFSFLFLSILKDMPIVFALSFVSIVFSSPLSEMLRFLEYTCFQPLFSPSSPIMYFQGISSSPKWITPSLNTRLLYEYFPFHLVPQPFPGNTQSFFSLAQYFSLPLDLFLLFSFLFGVDTHSGIRPFLFCQWIPPSWYVSPPLWPRFPHSDFPSFSSR